MFCKKGALEKIIVTNVDRIVACNHTKNKRILKNRSNYRTPFFDSTPLRILNKVLKLYLYKLNKFIVTNFYNLKILERLKSDFRISSETYSEHPRSSSFQKWSTVLRCYPFSQKARPQTVDRVLNVPQQF